MDKMKEQTITDQTTNEGESNMEQENANLPAQASANLPATTPEQTAAENILRRPKRSLPLLRFLKDNVGGWIFKIGDETIPMGTEYFAFWQHWKIGWVRWENGRMIEGPSGCFAEGFVMPERPSGAKDHNGRYVWQEHNWLPLEKVETGEFCIFVTGSAGGRMAIEEVADTAASQIVAGRNRGNPIIALAPGTFPSKQYGSVPRPKFQIIGSENDSGKTATPIIVPPAPPPPKPVPKSDTSGDTDSSMSCDDTSGAMDDDIPFN
jgi:hypothetical protein